MKKSFQQSLEKLTKEQLISVISDTYTISRSAQPILEQAVAAFDPKALYKVTNKNIASLKNGKRFITYHESFDFSEKLDQVNHGIEQLIPQDPDLALKLIQRFIGIDSLICERVDDSSGFMTDCYCTTYALLDRAFIATETDPHIVANYLYEVISIDEYGLRGYVLDNVQQSLRAGAGQELETLLTEKPLDGYQHNSALMVIADASNDVDRFIELSQQEAKPFDRPMSDQSILDIAKRLNAAFRSEEAIEWLQQIDDNSHHYSEKIKLLIEAYALEGKDQEVRQLLWKRFERYLSAEDFLAYLKHASEEDRQVANSKALGLAKEHSNLGVALGFLVDIKLWDEVESMIVENAKNNSLDGYDYSRYRKLSTTLDKQEKPLAATLLRRTLVEEVLSRAQSKYYHYGVSDLKKADDFSQSVTDWRGFDDHQGFLEKLKAEHHRKHAFWSKLDPS